MFSTSNVAATIGQSAQPPQNPMQAVEQMALVRNLLNQSKLFQSQQAAGRAVQGALRPDGTIDQSALFAGLSSDPTAALAALPAAQGGAVLARQTIANTTNAQQLQAARISALRQTIAGIPPGPNQEALARAALNRGVANGLWTSDDAAAYAGEGLPDLIREAAIQTGSAPAEKAQFGDITNVNTGSTMQPVVQQFPESGPTTQTNAPGSPAIPMTMTPGEKAARISGIDPETGAAFSVPQSAITTPTGEPVPNVKGVTGAHGEIATGLGPGKAATLATTGAGEGTAALNLQQTAAGVPQRKANLTLLGNEADQFATGPQSGFWKGLGSLAAEYGLQFPGAPSAGQTAASEAFSKTATQILAAQTAAAGLAHTNYQTEVAGAMAPNATMSPQGVRKVISILQGNEDYINAQYQLWEKSHGLYGTFDQFQATFNQKVNPLVFQAQYASPEDRAKIVKEVGAPAFKAQWKALYGPGGLLNGGQ